MFVVEVGTRHFSLSHFCSLWACLFCFNISFCFSFSCVHIPFYYHFLACNLVLYPTMPHLFTPIASPLAFKSFITTSFHLHREVISSICQVVPEDVKRKLTTIIKLTFLCLSLYVWEKIAVVQLHLHCRFFCESQKCHWLFHQCLHPAACDQAWLSKKCLVWSVLPLFLPS